MSRIRLAAVTAATIVCAFALSGTAHAQTATQTAGGVCVMKVQWPRWMQKSTTSVRARFSGLSLKIPSASFAIAP